MLKKIRLASALFLHLKSLQVLGHMPLNSLVEAIASIAGIPPLRVNYSLNPKLKENFLPKMVSNGTGYLCLGYRMEFQLKSEFHLNSFVYKLCD